MTFVTLDSSREGLAGFSEGHEVIARDDLGDVLAVDAEGRVWLFDHDAGDWSASTPAFSSVEQLHAFIAFQQQFEIPDDEGVAALRARKRHIETFLASMVAAPYAESSIALVLDELREAIDERRFWKSKAGKSIADRQACAVRCERALSDAGAPGKWMIRPHVDEPRKLVVIGRFTPTWDEARVGEVLAPVLDAGLGIVCRQAPPTW